MLQFIDNVLYPYCNTLKSLSAEVEAGELKFNELVVKYQEYVTISTGVVDAAIYALSSKLESREYWLMYAEDLLSSAAGFSK